MTTIEWKEPPADGRGSRLFDWEVIVAACKERPGQWALIGHDVWSSHSSSAKAHGLNARFVGTDSGHRSKGDLYVRWLPDGPQPVNTLLGGGAR